MQTMLSSLYATSLILGGTGVFLLFLFLRNCTRRFRKQAGAQTPLRSKKRMRDTIHCLLSLTILFAGIAVFNFALFMQTFRIFVEGEPVARIIVEPAEEGSTFEITVEMAKADDESGEPVVKTFALQGDKWQVEGNVVRFQDWLYYFGFKPAYQLSRVSGGYFFIRDEKSQPRTVHSLIDRDDEMYWEWMYRYSKTMPFVQITFGTAVSQSAEPGEYIVKILPTGLTLER